LELYKLAVLQQVGLLLPALHPVAAVHAAVGKALLSRASKAQQEHFIIRHDLAASAANSIQWWLCEQHAYHAH
jgi:DNA-binding IclR family transcriptional regulator